MKAGRKRCIILLVLLSVAALLAGGLLYITSVQNALWTKAVTDILEVTAQGRHALDTYIEKDAETLHLLAGALEKIGSDNSAAIQDILRLYSAQGADYLCVDLKAGAAYTGARQERFVPTGELQDRGVREPFTDEHTGVWTIAIYERFSFADGTEGYVEKREVLSDIAERFSLSFYNDSGFSYVVKRDGKILIRSLHRNSNRTFQNLFDIISLQDNDMSQVASFRDALENGKRGVARFQYQKEAYVFCYVPLENAAGWDVVSIVPDRVIMEQAHSIIRHSRILLLFILVCALILAAFFLIYLDSMQRVLLAEEKARKAAESANLAKSRFLSTMSHDIRTPMNAVIGMARLATEHINEPEKLKEYLKNIRMSGQLLVGLINDILDMSKIESGKMTLNNDTASLVDLITDLVNIVQPTVWQKKQNFNIRLHNIKHETLCFDALRLNQVLLNLLSNAMKYTPEGGSIDMDVTERSSSRGGYTHFTFRVADTGIGMKPAFLEHLFTSFSREQDSRVNRIEGSGLGMAITKMIVELMEGAIAVESEPGKGSVFTVDLDLLLRQEPSLTETPLPPMRVLVADDDPATCQSAAAFLSELGVSVDTARCGKDAVEKALDAHRQGERYKLVLLDWRMPDVSGVQALRAIREYTGMDTPIVIFSAYDWVHIEAEALQAGATGFLQKPFFKSSLYRCIQQYVLHEALPAERQTQNEELAGRFILLAEDNLLNQEIAQELLEGFGARVETVENGLDCVERFEQAKPGHFDLILMDVHMPVMNGYEATRKIRAMAREDAVSIPIIAMTADAFAEDIDAAKKAGMNSHLAKPLDIPVMLREIRKYLAPQRPIL